MIDSIRNKCNGATCLFVSDGSKWVEEEEISSFFPNTIRWIDRLDDKGEYTYWGDERRVLISVTEKIEKGAIAPLDYIEDELSILILHDRTRKLFEDVRNDLYKKAVDNNDIKFYIK